MMSVFAYFGIFCFITFVYVFVSEKIKVKKAKKLAKKLNIDTTNWKVEHYLQFYNAQKIAKKLGTNVEEQKPSDNDNIVIDNKN